MTVSTTATKQQFAGDGSSTSKTITAFTFVETDDIKITSRVDGTGVTSVLTAGVHYTVSGGDYGTGAIGIISPGTNFPSGSTWTVERVTDVTQTADYVENSSVSATVQERTLDKLTFLAQESSDGVSRSIRIPSHDPAGISTELPSSKDRAGKSLGFDADGAPTLLTGSATGSVTVTDYMATVLDDENATAAKSTLAISAGPITTRGDLIQGSSDAPPVPARLAHPGAANRYLTTSATDVAWSTKTLPVIAGSGDANKLLRVNAGGTGFELVAPVISEDTGWVPVAASLSSGSGSADHSLSGSPKIVTCSLECLDTDAGYAVGDRVLAFWVDAIASGYVVSFTFQWNSAKLGFSWNGAGNVFMSHKSNQDKTAIVAGFWRPSMRAFY